MSCDESNLGAIIDWAVDAQYDAVDALFEKEVFRPYIYTLREN